MRRCGGLDIPLAPPVMQLHSKAPLRCAFPLRRTTYTRTGGFCLWANQRMARQNPPVLLPLERLCSARKHPLSSGSGRQRYNTLDLASKIVCHETAGFIGFFLPRRALPSIGFQPPRVLCPLWIPLPTGRSTPLLDDSEPKELPSLWNPSPF